MSPIITDPVADAEEAERIYGLQLAPMEEIRDMDAVILAVAHEEFRSLAPRAMAAFFRNENRVLVDVKGILDKAEYEAAGYRYWRL